MAADGPAVLPKAGYRGSFTPATGQRLGHVDHQNIRAPAIVEAVKGLTDPLGVSSWHVLFLDEASSKQLCDCDMPQRLTTQFHWFNQGYRDFQDFLDRFSSRKRKNLRRERDRIAQQGLSLKTLKGDEITSEHWQFFSTAIRPPMQNAPDTAVI